MKKSIFLILFLGINILAFGSNVYFLNSGSGYVYTNGQSFNNNALVAYHLWADPTKYTVDVWSANFQDPDGNWTGWSYNSGSQGGHECLKAGTWHVKGRVHVVWDIYGYSDYWMYTSFTLSFNVVDNNAPSAPQNLSTSWVNGGEEDGNPRIEWNANTEPDLANYEIWKRIDNYFDPDVDWFVKNTTASNYYVDLSEDGWGTMGPPRNVYYKIKAVDVNDNKSSYSSSVMFVCDQELNKKASEKLVSSKPITYNLGTNYPNPFNPTTTLSYQLPKAGFVTLKVYDILGKEVAELVNENKSAGVYNVTFNASNLTSGLYFYKLQSGEFADIRKMLLTK